jgi:carotenoid cleavage dioxygenase
MHYDLRQEKTTVHEFGDDIPTEPVFVPRSAEEGDGYLLVVVYRVREDRSDVVILDAKDVAAKPLAVIKIPHRIPFGFHGNFVRLD